MSVEAIAQNPGLGALLADPRDRFGRNEILGHGQRGEFHHELLVVAFRERRLGRRPLRARARFRHVSSWCCLPFRRRRWADISWGTAFGCAAREMVPAMATGTRASDSGWMTASPMRSSLYSRAFLQRVLTWPSGDHFLFAIAYMPEPPRMVLATRAAVLPWQAKLRDAPSAR
jgi:hypothetical protein